MSENQDANSSKARNSAKNFREEQRIRIETGRKMFTPPPEFWKRANRYKPVEEIYTRSIKD